MSATRSRAWLALSNRLRELLPDNVVSAFVGGTHTRRFADNLLPGLSQSQITMVRGQLSQGSGNELGTTATGKRPAHAPYSSAALAVNAFGRWLGSEANLRVSGLGGFVGPLAIEEKLKIAHGGGTANLDCFLRTDDAIVGIESKLTEMLDAHDPIPWKAPYLSPQMSGLLDRGWARVFSASLKCAWQPKHVGLEQLIKHALALASRQGGVPGSG